MEHISPFIKKATRKNEYTQLQIIFMAYKIQKLSYAKAMFVTQRCSSNHPPIIHTFSDFFFGRFVTEI